MTTSVRFRLSYDSLKMGLYVRQINIMSIRKRIVDTDIASDVTSKRQKCYHTSGHTIFMTWRYPLNNCDVI